MDGLCRYCRGRLRNPKPQFVTRGLCDSCAEVITGSRRNVAAFIDTLGVPILFMQAEPRQVVTANRWAREIFSKELPAIEDHRGGEVFDCENSFTELGCGQDPKCFDCGVKAAVVHTFASGASHAGVRASLPIRGEGRVEAHNVVVSTERIGKHALLRIDCFTKQGEGGRG